jgi:hypothetical protein
MRPRGTLEVIAKRGLSSESAFQSFEQATIYMT